MDTASEETGYVVQNHKTQHVPIEMPFTRSQRAMILRKHSGAVKHPPVERTRRVRSVHSSNNRNKGPLVRIEKSEVSSESGGRIAPLEEHRAELRVCVVQENRFKISEMTRDALTKSPSPRTKE